MANHYNTNDLTSFVNENLTKLVPDQKHAFETIVDSVNNNKGKIFFLDAPGGTGKTFLANLIIAKIRQSGKIAIAVASSGIAATLLNDGKTAHSTFKLLLSVNLEQQSTCSIRKNGPLGKLLQDASLIMWDEYTMSHRAHIEAVDRTLKDLRNSCALMGGITFVFAGDFRKTLPVINRSTRADIIKACLKSSPLWTTSIENLKLRTNMRAHLHGITDSDFPQQLLKIGEGIFPTPNLRENYDDFWLTGQIVHNLDNLIDAGYPDMKNLHEKDYHWLCSRAIVSPRNDTVNDINNMILQKVSSQIKIYRSIDTVTNIENAVHYPQEFFNSLNPSGLPPHELTLKIGIPIILLRNLSPPSMCNGIRLLTKELKDNLIVATIITGPAAGQLAHIPRIPMIPTDLSIPFKRVQFPVKISFALTINKSQGQTFELVGIDRPTKGMFYSWPTVCGPITSWIC
ncbi:ATP-dependent DNA helicase pif1-like [Metopolophium dirhodum]|uniref:ATP-dependent DNA helicase pif1-like n=1 Tax=Metopolophium dirhodum TaxID=44670 RepID=UPI00298F44AB|nr:ATP-dependent DNA helicase pif1-like [Metopolophium dirhodum]XP_060873915.1 ATP-dependent DNA helicase pif1-like [Metopolophium dirhodum]XP_060873919.1 ATP-dependent DNA helicase pif1-like [Metopolophium dirhodum]